MDYQLGFTGDYISAALIGSSTPTLKLESIRLEKVAKLGKSGEETGELKNRLVARFEGREAGWLINRTNAECLRAMWGRDTDDWVGHRVTLCTESVRVGPKMEPGIRVKGSPELAQPLTFQLALPRKKPVPVTLVPTGKPARSDDAT